MILCRSILSFSFFPPFLRKKKNGDPHGCVLRWFVWPLSATGPSCLFFLFSSLVILADRSYLSLFARSCSFFFVLERTDEHIRVCDPRAGARVTRPLPDSSSLGRALWVMLLDAMVVGHGWFFNIFGCLFFLSIYLLC